MNIRISNIRRPYTMLNIQYLNIQYSNIEYSIFEYSNIQFWTSIRTMPDNITHSAQILNSRQFIIDIGPFHGIRHPIFDIKPISRSLHIVLKGRRNGSHVKKLAFYKNYPRPIVEKNLGGYLKKNFYHNFVLKGRRNKKIISRS